MSVVKKLGKELSRDTEMLGSYPPKSEFGGVDIGGGEYMEAPTGMLARGEYKADMKVCPSVFSLVPLSLPLHGCL